MFFIISLKIVHISIKFDLGIIMLTVVDSCSVSLFLCLILDLLLFKSNSVEQGETEWVIVGVLSYIFILREMP